MVEKSINPTELKFNVTRISYGPQNSVIIEGPDFSSSAFTTCIPLLEAGLEIKPSVKMKPRMIVHDIPVELSSEWIVKCIAEQNLMEASASDIKTVFLYSSREKKFRSCVIEINLEHRRQLLSVGRVNIGWQSYRIDDHITSLQCLNCLGFGHVAESCKKPECCSKCGETHAAKGWKATVFKRINCATAGYNFSHCATDKVNSSILRRKIDRKKSFIYYRSD